MLIPAEYAAWLCWAIPLAGSLFVPLVAKLRRRSVGWYAVLVTFASVILSVPVVVGTVATQSFTQSVDLSLSSALWDLRAVDVLAQGLVILTAALGVVLLLKEERRRK